MQEEITKNEENEIPFTEVVIDEEKVKNLTDAVFQKEKELDKKVYGISMTARRLQVYNNIIQSLKWRGKEALGIIEICKKINEITNKGISNDIIFMKALEIEATHYFLNRYESSTYKDATEFIDLYNSFDVALNNISADNKDLADLKKELAGAQQGLNME